MSEPGTLPGYSEIARALRATTERLAREVVSPSQVPPAWNDFEWGVARAVCAMHGLGALLANRLRWPGPVHWKTFLREQRDHGRAHYDRAGEVLGRLDTLARETGIACVALKGSALRALALHQPGERPMGDIDVLVEARDVPAFAALLGKMGYEPAFSMRRHEVFVPVAREAAHAFAEHLRNPLRIEVHPRIAECLPVSPVDITAGLWPASVQPGVNAYASRAALMRHLLLHTAGNMRAHVMRFIQIYDIARLGHRLGADEWRELLDWWVYPPLAMAERYVPGSIPGEVLEEFRAACPLALRLRADRYDLYRVSWSNLRISALPGAEWARTPLELARFAKSRAWPDRTALQEMTDSTRAQPAYQRVRWYEASHAERILRWVFSRPPRVQTLVSVRAALEQSQPA